MTSFFSVPAAITRRDFVKSAAVMTVGLLSLPSVALSNSLQPLWVPCPPGALRYTYLQPDFCRYGSYNVASLKNGEIRIFGWFLCEDINGNFILPERIYSILDQNEILQGSPVSPRPDVGRVYPSAPLNAGFDFRCREPRHSVSVWVLNTGGSLSQGRPGNYYPQRKDDL